MSTTAIATTAGSHLAAGNGLAIGLYIEELTAMNYSPARIARTLEREGLVVPARSSKPASCQHIEAALLKQDYIGAVFAARALKAARSRDGYRTQMSCLRMRLEYQHGQDHQVVKLLMSVRRCVG